MKLIFTHYFDTPEANDQQVLAVRHVLYDLYLRQFGRLPPDGLMRILLSVCHQQSIENYKILLGLRQLTDIHYNVTTSTGYTICHGEDVARFRAEIIAHYSPVVVSPLTLESDRDEFCVGVVIIEPQYLELIPDFFAGIVSVRFPKDFSGANAKPHSGSVFVLSTDAGSVSLCQKTPDMELTIDDMADECRSGMGGVGVGNPIRRPGG